MPGTIKIPKRNWGKNYQKMFSRLRNRMLNKYLIINKKLLILRIFLKNIRIR